jgi:sulfite exporter TauE/SafE
LARQLSYNLGRVTTYCFIGALVGFLAAGLCTSGPAPPPTAWGQRILAVVSGLLMVFLGLQFLGWVRRRHGGGIGFGGQILARALRDVLRTPGPAAPVAFGVFNGFLPCPLVYAFAAQAAGSGGALPGLLVMLTFGLGTFPAMLLMGGIGSWLHRRTGPRGERSVVLPEGGTWRWRRRGVDFAGALIVVLGLITVARGVLPIAGHLHVQ